MIKLVAYYPNTKIPNPSRLWTGTGLGGLECKDYFAVDWDSEDVCDLILPDTCLVRRRQNTNKVAFLFRGPYSGKLHPSDKFEIIHGKNRYIACFGQHVQKNVDKFVPTNTNYFWETPKGQLIDPQNWRRLVFELPITNIDHLWPKPVRQYKAPDKFDLPDDFDKIMSSIKLDTYWAWTMAGFALYALLGDDGLDYFLSLCDNQESGRAKYDNISMTFDASRMTSDPVSTLRRLAKR